MSQPSSRTSQPIDPRVFAPGSTPNTVRSADGKEHRIPANWSHLPPGDPGLTRRVKATENYWIVQEKKGRKVFSKGLFAPADVIESIRRELEAERGTEAYAKKRASATLRREKEQSAYVEDFHGAVVEFLDFHPAYEAVAEQLASAITTHATPVGSGTVARTQRIPIEQRAESAVIAWMRHQTTAYDSMKIARIKGERREVRRMLALHSRKLLESYRRGEPSSDSCPLRLALARKQAS